MEQITLLLMPLSLKFGLPWLDLDSKILKQNTCTLHTIILIDMYFGPSICLYYEISVASLVLPVG